jgi:Cu(I)/Ag(I) efflux system membrane protein CusA/SilA
MVGGLVSSTVLTLIVIPVIYYLWKSREINKMVTSKKLNESANSKP